MTQLSNRSPKTSIMSTERAARPGAVRRGGVMTFVMVGVAVALVASIGAYVAFSGGDSGRTTASHEIHLVDRMSFDVTVTSSGEIEAVQQTEIRSRLESPAAIVELVDEGAQVRQGELLVRLASEAIERNIEEELLRVESARSDLVAAENSYEIQLNENEAALRQAQLKLELSRIELNKWEEGDLVKRREELSLDIEKAERDLERLREKFEQSQSLFERGFLSKDDYQLDEIRLLEGEARVRIAELNQWVYETYEVEKQRRSLTSNVEEALADLDRVQRQNASRLASREADVINRRRQLSIREERLARHRQEYEATSIRAPTDGLVVYATSLSTGRGMSMMGGDGPLQIGRNIRPNELIMILPDTTRMAAAVRVHESNAARIRPGQKANVRVDAAPGQVFAGRVLSTSVLAESGGWRDPNLREYTVRIALDQDNADQLLKPSMRADAEIILSNVSDSLAVPVQAVFREGRVSYVYTPQGSRFVRTPVRVGRRSTTHAEVLAGLDTGDRVLLREPRTGEVIDREFDEQALAAVLPPEMPMGPGGMPPGAGRQMQMMNPGAPGGPGNAGQGARQSGDGGDRSNQQRQMRPGQGTPSGAATESSASAGTATAEKAERSSDATAATTTEN